MEIISRTSKYFELAVKNIIKVLTSNIFFYIALIVCVTFVAFIRLFITKGVIIFHDTSSYVLNMRSFDLQSNFTYIEKSAGAVNLPQYIGSYYLLNKIYHLLNVVSNNKDWLSLAWFFLPYLLVNIAIFFFFLHFFRNKIVAFILTLLYFFSIQTSYLLTGGYNVVQWSIFGGILFLLFYFKYLEAFNKIYLIASALVSPFAMINQAYFYSYLIALACIFLVTIFALKQKSKIVSKLILDLIFLLALIFLINAYSILPMLISLLGTKLEYGTDSDAVLNFQSKFATSLHNFLFVGYIPTPWAETIFSGYLSNLYKFIHYFFVGIILFLFAKTNHENRKSDANSIQLTIFIVFLILFTFSFGKNLFFWGLLERIPGWFLARVPGRFLSLSFIFFITSIGFILVSKKNRLRFAIVLLFLLINIIYYFKSDFFYYFPKTAIPNDYTLAVNYLSLNGNASKKIMIFHSTNLLVQYSWVKYPTMSLFELLTKNPIIMDSFYGFYVPRSLLVAYSETLSCDTYKKLFDLSSVEYIVNDKGMVPNSNLIKLEGCKYFESVFNSKYVDIYKLNENANPLIYLPKQIVFNKKSEEIYQTLTVSPFVTKNTIFPNYYKHDLSLKDEQRVSTLSSMLVSKISPSKYLLALSNVEGEVPIVFNFNYDSKWKLNPMNNQNLDIDYRNWIPIQESDKYHIVANGFANAWMINIDQLCSKINCQINKDGSKNLRLTLEYLPERYFQLGKFISAITLLMLFSFLLASKFKKEK